MFKWPEPPSVRASEHELADYVELIGWKDGSTSKTAICKLLGRLDENDYSADDVPEEDLADDVPEEDPADGVPKESTDGVPEEEKIDKVVGEAFEEIERRDKACRDGYPFDLDEEGYTLRTRDDKKKDDKKNHKYIIYKYMLLATRLDMKDNRKHAEIDGTFLFEKLAAEAARNYFGSRTESRVFGAQSGAGFSDKINELCKWIGEGNGFKNHGGAKPTEKDGKVDVVAWKHFADRLAGKLIAFGQCKTGTSYKDTLTQLQPSSFCRKWLREPPVFDPMRMFFIAEALCRSQRSQWRNTVVDAGLLFDRCRIVDFCDEVNEDVRAEIVAWTKAAAEAKATKLLATGS